MEFAQLRGYAIGVIGIRPQDFGEMRPGGYWAVVKAYQQAENDRLMYIGELTRGFCARVINLFAKPKIRKFRDFWPMPWDKNEVDFEVGQINEKDRKTQVQELLKRVNNG